MRLWREALWLGCAGVLLRGLLLGVVAHHARDEQSELAEQVGDRTHLQPRNGRDVRRERAEGACRARVQREGCRARVQGEGAPTEA